MNDHVSELMYQFFLQLIYMEEQHTIRKLSSVQGLVLHNQWSMKKKFYQNIMPQISFSYTTHFSCWKKLCTEYLTPCVRYWGAALNWFQGKSCLDCQWKKYDAYYYTKFTGLQARLLCLQNQVLKILLAIFSSSTALGVFSNNGGKLGNLVRSTWNQARVYQLIAWQWTTNSSEALQKSCTWYCWTVKWKSTIISQTTQVHNSN